VRARSNLPTVIADLDRRGKAPATVNGFTQHMVANFLAIDLSIDHINGLAAIDESKAELTAFTQPFTCGIVLCKILAIRTQAHQIELARFGVIDAAIDPGKK
jgi:hypothetical protein